MPEHPSLLKKNKDSLAQDTPAPYREKAYSCHSVSKRKKWKERLQKKKINKSFGSTRGKNLQLEKAFVLIVKHGITVISQL